jgi:hypothetical protein
MRYDISKKSICRFSIRFDTDIAGKIYVTFRYIDPALPRIEANNRYHILARDGSLYVYGIDYIGHGVLRHSCLDGLYIRLASDITSKQANCVVE